MVGEAEYVAVAYDLLKKYKLFEENVMKEYKLENNEPLIIGIGQVINY